MRISTPSDLYLARSAPLRDQHPVSPFTAGARLFQDRWAVEQVVPSSRPPPDYEVYARRTRLAYSVYDIGKKHIIGGYMAETRVVGDVITVGVDRFRVRAIRPLVSELLDALLSLEPVRRSRDD